MSLCEHCVAVVRHEGEPTGKVETINGVPTYVALPETDYPKDKAILFLPDVFGFELSNNKLLADGYARNGFQVYIPDYLNGDPVPPDVKRGGDFDIPAWFAKHGQDKTRPPLDKVIAGLKERGITTFGANGYCFGGRYVFDLAFDNVIKVAVVTHPSLLKVPDDLEKYKAKAMDIPLLVVGCEFDERYSPASQKIGDDILGGGNMTGPGYRREYFVGCTHGFAVRGDMKDDTVKAGKEGAFKAAVEWFIKHV